MSFCRRPCLAKSSACASMAVISAGRCFLLLKIGKEINPSFTPYLTKLWTRYLTKAMGDVRSRLADICHRVAFGCLLPGGD